MDVTEIREQVSSLRHDTATAAYQATGRRRTWLYEAHKLLDRCMYALHQAEITEAERRQQDYEAWADQEHDRRQEETMDRREEDDG